MSESEEKKSRSQAGAAAAETEQLYEEVRGVLRRLLTRTFRVPEEDAEQLVYETFSAWQMLGGPKIDPMSWLVTAACENVRTYLRRGGQAISPSDAENRARAFQRKLAYEVALETLPPRARDALRLHWEENMTYAEVAAALRISTFAAEHMVKKAAMKVRRLLREREG